jgi:hypothetical protein
VRARAAVAAVLCALIVWLPAVSVEKLHAAIVPPAKARDPLISKNIFVKKRAVKPEECMSFSKRIQRLLVKRSPEFFCSFSPSNAWVDNGVIFQNDVRSHERVIGRISKHIKISINADNDGRRASMVNESKVNRNIFVSFFVGHTLCERVWKNWPIGFYKHVSSLQSRKSICRFFGGDGTYFGSSESPICDKSPGFGVLRNTLGIITGSLKLLVASFPKLISGLPKSRGINDQPSREDSQKNIGYFQVVKKLGKQFGQFVAVAGLGCGMMALGGFLVASGDCLTQGFRRFCYHLFGWLLALTGPWIILAGLAWLGFI